MKLLVGLLSAALLNQKGEKPFTILGAYFMVIFKL